MDNPALMDNPAVWAFAGAVTTAVIGLIGALIKYRGDQRKDAAEIGKMKAEAQSIAVDAAEKALGTVTDALENAQATISDLTRRVTAQDERLTEMGKAVGEVRRLHQAAISHIADRERWTAKRWPGSRPETLAEIPPVLRADVIEAAPDLATVVVITPREHNDDEADEADEDPQPRARLPPND